MDTDRKCNQVSGPYLFPSGGYGPLRYLPPPLRPLSFYPSHKHIILERKSCRKAVFACNNRHLTILPHPKKGTNSYRDSRVVPRAGNRVVGSSLVFWYGRFGGPLASI